MKLNVGLGACNPLQLPLFSTWFAKHLNAVIKGEGIFLLLAQCFPIVILKEPKRVFRIYIQRVVMLHCELSCPRMQNPFLPLELGVLRSSESDIRGG